MHCMDTHACSAMPASPPRRDRSALFEARCPLRLHAGETTDLGQPFPGSRSQQGGEGGAGGSGAGAGAGGSSSASHDPRAEGPLEDKTAEYAAIGVFTGAFLGWFSQFV